MALATQALVTLALTALAIGCAPQDSSAPAGSAADPPSAAPGGRSTADSVPSPDLEGMETQVAERLRTTRGAILEDPESAAAWGEFAKVAHAHELWEEARVAYEEAQRLDPSDERWPYFLGDLRSVIGTDLAGAASAFRRALTLRRDYAPAHMRLGRVLVADNQADAAAKELERALTLDPDLQPAQVTLAQIELARGALDRAESLLDAVLAEAPRHAQALSTIGQVYMRTGRRDEARAVAARARDDAALYNLFTDPMMGEVIQEGSSSLLIWERAKAFLEDGNFRQASLGLAQVVRLQPDNVEARYQLAIVYGNLDQPEKSLSEMEKVVEADPSLVDAQVQLGKLHLDLGRPASAVDPLRRVLERAPDDPDAGWLLGRAEMATGAVHRAVATFESAREAARRSGASIPSWAHNDWGAALAQTGRLQEAFSQFEKALAADPNDPQTLFYLGLVYEGTGRPDEAVEYYCRSTRIQPNPPSAERLQRLGRTCP
ncbi:MAG: tetratricopeptide repeat protein [Acidobacteriota bacterium]